MGIVFNIQKFCIHDGDGIRTCVFLKGCPLRCIWCHNPEGLEKASELLFDKHKCSSCGRCVDICNARAVENGRLTLDRKQCTLCGSCMQICLHNANEISGIGMTAQEIIDEVVKDRIFYDTSGGGLTVTGGEPSYQPDFTLEILRLAGQAGISCAIETCGIGSREFYAQAAETGATFLYDIKCIDPDRHRRLTGADNSRITENLRFLMDFGADIILRLPMIPDCNDSDEDIALLADFLKRNKGRYRYAELMPYHCLGTGKSEKTGISSAYIHENATDEEISRWLRLFEDNGAEVKVSV